MDSPQKENGYTPIANEIMEALCKTRIKGEARQVLDFILRKTYGWNKKEDGIALSQFAKATNLKIPNICRSLKYLIQMNIIIKSDNTIIKNDNGWMITYGFNKHYTTWKPLSKVIMPLSKRAKATIKSDNQLLSKVIDTKALIKTTIQKQDNPSGKLTSEFIIHYLKTFKTKYGVTTKLTKKQVGIAKNIRQSVGALWQEFINTAFSIEHYDLKGNTHSLESLQRQMATILVEMNKENQKNIEKEKIRENQRKIVKEAKEDVKF